MDFEVPLNRLIFGQEDGAGINARTTGRDDGIAELAANIHARGQIENLVVKVCGDNLYSVSNGNRRLAAFHMIYGADSSEPIRCTLRDVDEAGAFEDSLTTAVTAKQLHPVDQYEAFARLRDRGGKVTEEIARVYGMTEREVDQALALGHLSPNVREAWRKGEIKAAAAKAFTLADSHKAQDDALTQLRADMDNGYSHDLDDDDVKEILKIDAAGGVLVEFVGIDAYVARGGKVTLDLFGTDHRISDIKLAKKMSDEKLAEECRRLKEAGWSFAVTEDSIRNTRYNYSSLYVVPSATAEEEARLAELRQILDYESDEAVTFKELTAPEQKAYSEHHAIELTIKLRAFTPKMMEKAGCFVGIDHNGALKIEYGKVKPAQKEKAAEVAKQETREQKKAAVKTAKAEGKPAPEPKVLSNALIERLEKQLVAATRDAIAGDPLLRESPFADVLARTICAQINVDRGGYMAHEVRTKLPSIRQTLDAGVFNAAIAKRFEAEDYFSSAPKGFVLKAIKEGINEDEARRVASKPKAEIGKFALANLGKSGWLPKELRTVHYKGPGSEGFKHPALVRPSSQSKVPSAMTDALAKAEKAVKPLKRAAAVRKAASKTAAKKKKR